MPVWITSLFINFWRYSLFRVFVKYLTDVRVTVFNWMETTSSSFTSSYVFYPRNFFVTNAIASWTLGWISIKMNLKITELCEWLLQAADLNFVVSNLYWRQLYSLVLLTTFSNKWSKNVCLHVSFLLYWVKQIVSQLKHCNCSCWGFLCVFNKCGTTVLKFVADIYRLWLNKNKESSLYLVINHCLFM